MILAGVVFALVLMAALLLTGYMERTAIRQKRDRMAHIAQSVGSETYETLLSEMGKTRVLEAYLIQTGGSYEGFEKVAPILLREEFVRNVLFAPDGVVEAGAIGLSNVRTRLSRSPGCGIEIESAPGQGTRVVLSYQKIPVEILTNSTQGPQ